MNRTSKGAVFDHVLVIVFENQYRGYVLANPYFRRLARRGVQLGNYFGVMHPSQTNYVASIAGELCGVTSDQHPPLLKQRTIVDLIEEAPGRLRWKGYMESFVRDATPWTPELEPRDAFPYVVKHNPFALFESVVRDRDRWARIDNEAAFFADVLNGELPEFAWFTPNMWSDGHWLDGTEVESKPRAPALVDQSARWLERFFDRLKFPGPDSHLPPKTLVVVTFDEADFEEDYIPEQDSPYDGPNQVYTVLLGDVVAEGTFEEQGYNHYSLLRTVEQNFSLGHLGKNDAGANWFQFLWNKRFEWSAPVRTPIESVGPIAAAGFDGALFVAYAGSDGLLRVRTLARGVWSDEELVRVDASGGVAIASTFDAVVIVARSAHGALRSIVWAPDHDWVVLAATLADATGAFALTSFDGEKRVALVWTDPDARVASRLWADGGWGDVVVVNAARSRGPITVGCVGASLYAIARSADGDALDAYSYNTASFNVVHVAPNKYGGPQDDSTVEQWAPCAVPVAHFSSWPDATGLRQPLARPYRAGETLACATLDGVLHLVYPAVEGSTLRETTFSLSGLLTPKNPISYKKSETDRASNGFGTLAEAGWSKPETLHGARCRADGAIAIGRSDGALHLLVREHKGATVELRVGRYRTRTESR
ncbi:MAG: phosphoesterase [Myxococcales bacterium]|nr:phosphoesterase [Myxococcales bacterium]